MKLLRHIDELEADCAGGTCITIGVFDAVHRGHQMVIRRARDQARMRAVKSLVFTFERHPLSLIAPAYCPPVLTQPDEKARLISELEVDLCLMLKFTPEIARIPADEFIDDILVRRCQVRYITCGWNFSFGAGGKGNTQMLKARGKELKFDVEILDPMRESASPISSTRVREHLLEGRVEDAIKFLQRRYGFEGEVVSGHQRGRQIGFPTANLKVPENQLIPADGVYAVLVRVEGATHGGMMNIGRRPTFEGAGRAMEVHLFNFSGDLLGKQVWVEFVERVREEKKFGSVDELVAQLKQDQEKCERICAAAMAGASAK
jgi:riboflavin kinase/FMN adenylyltransferase